MNEFATMLHGAGLKATAPRLALLAALRQDRSHPTAEELHERLREDQPTLSLSTVYLGLEAFLSSGLCRKVPARDGKMRIDGVPSPHDHALCNGCGEVFDIDADLFPRPPGPPRLPGGLLVHDVHIEYAVTCSACNGNGHGIVQPLN